MKILKTIALIGLCFFTLSCSRSDSGTEELPKLTQGVTRTWIGPEYWTNPLMNWQLSDGKFECTHGGWSNELHSLTHQLRAGEGSFQTEVIVGPMNRPGVTSGQEIFAGFTLAALGHRNDYRSNILHELTGGFSEELQQESPVRVGITSEGRLRIDSVFSDKVLSKEELEGLKLSVSAMRTGSKLTVKLTTETSAGRSEELQTELTRGSFTGNIALACHPVETPLRK